MTDHATVPETPAPAATGAAPAAGHDAGHGGHQGFDFAAALAHHNLPYPAWDPLGGRPILIFDLPRYAAGHQGEWAAEIAKVSDADAGHYAAWAQDYAARPVNHDMDAGTLAKAMVVAGHHAPALPRPLSWMNQQLFFGTIALTLMALVLVVFFRRSASQLKPEGRIQHMLEAIVLFVRDDIVRPNMHHGDAWVPHFAAIFLAILSCNLIGLIPGTGTATGNIAVTSALAITTFLSMLFFGMKEQGVVRYWINLVPVHWSTKPADMAIWIMLFGIELIGLLIKPTALAIRLFANMFAGHTVLLAFCTLGLILYYANVQPGWLGFTLSTGGGAFGWVMATLIFFLELLVAFIQAYVFTLLSAIFIGQSIHPEH